ncbi:Cleavage polyadenylation factor subunit fip1 [Rhizina undulata]
MDDDDEYLYGDQPSTTTTTAATTTTPAPPTTHAVPLPADPTPPPPKPTVPGLSASHPSDTPMSDRAATSLESGEEEEVEVSDTSSEVSFIIERKDGSRPEPPPVPSRYNQVRMAPTRPDSKPTPPQQKPEPSPTPGNAALHPPTATSKLDLNANPTYNGTPITKISMDSDAVLPADKPWRKPGADVTDYFNFGFDEFTWTAYCQKQEGLREEFDPRKMMEQMMMLSGLGMGMGLPGIDTSNMDMNSMMAGPGGFGMPGNVAVGAGVSGPPTGPSAGAGGQDMAMGGMGDPGMYAGMQGGVYDERAAQGGYNMAADPRRTGMPPQGPNAGPQAHMGAYGGFDQGMMQGAGRGGYVGRGGRGRRGGW